MIELLQDVLPNWLADAGILLGGLILATLAYFNAKFPRLVQAVLYGLVGICLLSITVLAFRAMAVLQEEPTQVTPENVEAHIRTWLDHFKLDTRKLSHADSHFAYEVTLKTKVVVTLKRLKDFDNYITLLVVLEPSKSQKVLLEKMKVEKRNLLIREMKRELARSKVESWATPPLENVFLQLRVPITSSLTEAIFIERLVDINSSFTIAQETLTLGLAQLPLP